MNDNRTLGAALGHWSRNDTRAKPFTADQCECPGMSARLSTRFGEPAHLHFAGRVTASMIREHGSYQAARAFLSAASGVLPPTPAQHPNGVEAGVREGRRL